MVAGGEARVLDAINKCSKDEAFEQFKRCCTSTRWVEHMVASRPFASFEALLAEADRFWQTLSKEDYLEAFAGHPKIGDVDAVRKKYASSRAWTEKEQAGVAVASDQVLEDLARGNTDYEQRFGYIFIVCATGKSADEMLALLRARLGNAPDAELKIAAGEQSKITRIRLEKLWQEDRSLPTS